MAVTPDSDPVAAAVALLAGPALVVLTGPPGCGRSTQLRQVTAALAPNVPVYAGGGLAMLSAVPALALSRAVRARLPAHDVHLLAEAVRSRVRGGLLVLDDLQYADPATLAALTHLAGRCRVLATLRTPHRLGASAEAALRSAAAGWLPVPPLARDAALDLARRSAAGRLGDDALAAVADRAGGNPLALTALARHAAAGNHGGGASVPGGIDQVAYASAAALADLPRAARTALAALGLLGRGAAAGLLGPGAADLQAAGLVTVAGDGSVQPVSTYLAEIAAGLLDAGDRAALHTRLAELTPPAEAARHLAAAGDHAAAYRRALHAADQATGGARAALLLFACDLDTPVGTPVRIAAADAALAAGRPAAAARVLTTGGPLGVEADVLRGEALLQAGDPAAARDAAAPVPDAAPAPVLAARDRVLLLAGLATDPAGALDLAAKIAARHPRPTPGVAAALAAVQAAHRRPGWDTALLAAATRPGDPAAARFSAWLLVEYLAADGRLTESADIARRAAADCTTDLAYGWQTRFVAAADWALALQSGGDDVLRHAADLTDRALPAEARGYATAATALIEADTGLLGAARAHLDAGPAHPAAGWVAQETAWLDGQPDRAADIPDPRTAGLRAGLQAGSLLAGPPADSLLPGPHAGASPAGPHADGLLPAPYAGGLLAGLQAITARWAAHDLGRTGTPPIPPGLPAAARRTLTAWATGTGFTAAADGWQPVARREQVRCLLAAGLTDTDPQRAVAALLAAEQLADAAGLSVLAGRARRGLRRHHIHRDTRSPRSGDRLTRRETDVLRLVAAGEPTRRIAGQLGISSETVDTHIRAGMRKLGARTRTEAAARAFAPEHSAPDQLASDDVARGHEAGR